MSYRWITFSLLAISTSAICQSSAYDGLNNTLGNLSWLSNAQSFSVTPENPTGEKGKAAMSKEGSAAKAAREVGQGWKENSFTVVRNGQTATLADVGGGGCNPTHLDEAYWGLALFDSPVLLG